jgi:hypothetical protein
MVNLADERRGKGNFVDFLLVGRKFCRQLIELAMGLCWIDVEC